MCAVRQQRIEDLDAQNKRASTRAKPNVVTTSGVCWSCGLGGLRAGRFACCQSWDAVRIFEPGERTDAGCLERLAKAGGNPTSGLGGCRGRPLPRNACPRTRAPGRSQESTRESRLHNDNAVEMENVLWKRVYSVVLAEWRRGSKQGKRNSLGARSLLSASPCHLQDAAANTRAAVFALYNWIGRVSLRRAWLFLLPAAACCLADDHVSAAAASRSSHTVTGTVPVLPAPRGIQPGRLPPSTSCLGGKGWPACWAIRAGDISGLSMPVLQSTCRTAKLCAPLILSLPPPLYLGDPVVLNLPCGITQQATRLERWTVAPPMYSPFLVQGGLSSATRGRERRHRVFGPSPTRACCRLILRAVRFSRRTNAFLVAATKVKAPPGMAAVAP